MEIGYNFQRAKMTAMAEKKKAKKAEEAKLKKSKVPGIDLNKRVDEVDKSTKKRLGVKNKYR